jgi:hypothetical protein
VVPYGYSGIMKVELIGAHETISAIKKERHARRYGGEHVQYFITDKHRRLLLSSGKLSALQAYINTHLATERHDKVNIGGLYESMGRSDPRTGGYYQHRWKVSRAPLEEAADVFEKLRPGFDQAVVVGSECIKG